MAILMFLAFNLVNNDRRFPVSLICNIRVPYIYEANIWLNAHYTFVLKPDICILVYFHWPKQAGSEAQNITKMFLFYISFHICLPTVQAQLAIFHKTIYAVYSRISKHFYCSGLVSWYEKNKSWLKKAFAQSHDWAPLKVLSNDKGGGCVWYQSIGL